MLPYIKSLSEAVRRILEEDGIKVIFKPFNKLGDILTHVEIYRFLISPVVLHYINQ